MHGVALGRDSRGCAITDTEAPCVSTRRHERALEARCGPVATLPPSLHFHDAADGDAADDEIAHFAPPTSRRSGSQFARNLGGNFLAALPEHDDGGNSVLADRLQRALEFSGSLSPSASAWRDCEPPSPPSRPLGTACRQMDLSSPCCTPGPASARLAPPQLVDEPFVPSGNYSVHCPTPTRGGYRY